MTSAISLTTIRTVMVLGTLLVSLCTFSMGDECENSEFTVAETADPYVLANTILGEGITMVVDQQQNVVPKFTGADGRDEPPVTAGVYSAGTFSGGLSAGLGIDEGIILTTGNVQNAVGPNSSDHTLQGNPTQSTINYLGCDPDLEWLLTGNRSCSEIPTENETREATILELTFESNSGNVSFNFVFASEEYNEFAYTGVNDVFGLFVDGENVALVPGTSTYVSIDTVNGGGGCYDYPTWPYPCDDPPAPCIPCPRPASNPQFYNDNDFHPGGPFPYCIEYDGFTEVFTATKLGLGPGTHTLKLAISDVGDPELDSAVFIEAGSLTDEPRAETLTCNCSTPTLFDPPADRDVIVKKGNRTIPLKFELCDEDGLPFTEAILPPMAEVDYLLDGEVPDFEPEEFLTSGHSGEASNLFDYVDGHWQLNLNTKMFTADGVYGITVVSTDPDYLIDPTCFLRFEIR